MKSPQPYILGLYTHVRTVLSIYTYLSTDAICYVERIGVAIVGNSPRIAESRIESRSVSRPRLVFALAFISFVRFAAAGDRLHERRDTV